MPVLKGLSCECGMPNVEDTPGLHLGLFMGNMALGLGGSLRLRRGEIASRFGRTTAMLP
jgi:hypothetical protein